MSRESSSPVQETSAGRKIVKFQVMESEATGIEVHVELPDGTKSERVIWQLDRCVKETKQWLLSESGIPTSAEQFDMVLELPTGATQILKDDENIDYYWDDLCLSLRLYFLAKAHVHQQSNPSTISS